MDESLNDALVRAYLGRLGIARPSAPTREALGVLVERHLANVPFENIDVYEGRPIGLGTRAAAEKIVERRRGGFCFELNEAFRGLLAALGFVVRRIEARVWAEPERAFGAPFDHLALVVSLSGADYLVDVGFGDNNRVPIRLPDGEAMDVSGRYRVGPVREGVWLLNRLGSDASPADRPLYEMTLEARPLDAFAAMCAYHQTSPQSIFTRGLVCTRPTPTGRVTLTANRLLLTDGDLRTERVVPDEAARRALFARHFGITS